MTEFVNLIVDLDERFDDAAHTRALRTMAIAGYAWDDRRGADDTTLAWVDETFGGAWSGEANAGWNVVASRDSAPVGFATYGQRPQYRWLRGIAREASVGIFGPFGVAPGERGCELGRALLVAALAGLRAQGSRRALIPAVSGEGLIAYYAATVGAQVIERFSLPDRSAVAPRTVLMASGNGSNVAALVERVRAGAVPIEIVVLVCDRANAYAIERARMLEVPLRIVEWERVRETRAEYDRRLLEVVRAESPDLLLLLGWMHLLDGQFVGAFPDILNLHPAYLPLDPASDDVGLPDGTRIPAFRGANAVRDALAAGSHWIGASVHRVTTQTDRGDVLIRAPLRVEPDESNDALMARLHALEHDVVARATLRWLNERE